MNPVLRVPIVQQVEDRIKTLIDEGGFRPDEKLPTEMELCQQLGVGRGTVREAFRSLQARGYVTIKPGRGAFVAAIPPDDGGAIDWLVENEKGLRDSIDIRAALEPMAARRMAEKCTDQDLRRLSDIHHAFLDAVAEEDAVKIAKLDEQFHSAIVAGSGNSLLIDINSHVCEGMSLFRNKTFQVEQNVRNVIEPHTNIFNAITQRNSDLAEREMRIHLEKVHEDLTRNISIPSHRKG